MILATFIAILLFFILGRAINRARLRNANAPESVAKSFQRSESTPEEIALLAIMVVVPILSIIALA